MNWKILCYHTVEKEQTSSFLNQLNWFQSKGYKYQSFSTAFEERNQKGKSITVTFDDGDLTACSVACNVLVDSGIQAMLYLSTDYILKGNCYKARHVRPAVTWDQLGRWIEAGHEIGNHTHTHADLTLCDEEKMLEELEYSQEIIKSKIGVMPVHFAYPWGRHNDKILKWFHAQSYWKSAVAVGGRGNDSNTDQFALGRYALTADWNVHELRLTVLSRPGRFLYRTSLTYLTKLLAN